MYPYTRDHIWTKQEDVCIIFFGSRGVFPDAIVDLLSLFCRSDLDAHSIHLRTCQIAGAEGLLSRDDGKHFHHDRVRAWIAAQETDAFARGLRFTNAVMNTIRPVSQGAKILACRC
jgi:predicted transcriptional regulator